mgnify:CR=1 FL=1
MSKEAMKLALEALETSMYPQQKQLQAITAIKEALMSVPDGAQPEQEPVGDALYFAQWTADKKDLSDYVLVGSLSLAGIEDGEYGQSEIDSFENAIEALQEKLVTGADHKKVPLLAYIGALNSTSPQPAQQEPVACSVCDQVREGQQYPEHVITMALKLTGDINDNG